MNIVDLYPYFMEKMVFFVPSFFYNKLTKQRKENLIKRRKQKMKRKMIAAAMTTSMILGTVAGSTAVHAEEKETFTIMHYWTDEVLTEGNAEGITLTHAIEKFQEEHPELDVVVETITQDAGYESKIKTLAAADELPDAFIALPSMMNAFYDNGQILDLAPILEEDKEWADTFADGAFGDFTFGDVILGVPRCAIANSILFYNTEIFKECGIDEFPSNTDEFLEAVKTLKENGYIPIADGNKAQYALASQVMPGILFKFASNDWYESTRNYQGGSFEDEEPVAAINYLKELLDAGAFNEDMNSIDVDQARVLYYTGQAAMYCEGSWVVSSFITDCDETVKENTELTIFPVAPGHEDLDSQIVSGQGWGIAVNSEIGEEKQALAIDFLKDVTSPEIQAESVERGLVSVLKDVPYDESKIDPLYNKFLDLFSSKETKVGCPEVQLGTEYMDASYTGYQELSVDAVTPEELAATLQEAHESAE